MVIKTLADLRRFLELNKHLPDTTEVAVDNGEEFRDFLMQAHAEGISIKEL